MSPWWARALWGWPWRWPRRVVVFEREEFAIGASVRNFGLVLPLGQPLGPMHDRAMRSREVWLEFVRGADLFHRTDGMLVLARHEDEQRVLEEYLAGLGDARHGRRMLTPAEAAERSPAVRLEGLRGALFSPTEMVVDPREALRALPDWLAERFGVQTHFSAPVEYFGMFARLPRPELSEQWHGIYLKHPTRTELLHEPEAGVTIVNGLGGGGMTLSFGLAEELAARQCW